MIVAAARRHLPGRKDTDNGSRITESIASNSAMSTCWPSPLRVPLVQGQQDALDGVRGRRGSR